MEDELAARHQAAPMFPPLKLAPVAASRKQCFGRPNENNEQHGPNAKAPSDELFLDGEQRLGRHLAKLFADIRFFTCHGIPRGIPLPARDRRLHAVEENPREDQTHP